MTYHTFGIEIETAGVSISRVKNALERAGVRGCQVKPDGTPSVDAEIVLPPLADCQVAYEYLQSVCNVLDSVGCQINTSCGLHVHISNAELIDHSPAAYTGASIAHTESRGGFLASHGEPLDFVIVQDIMHRYERQQDTLNTMFARSRTMNRYCAPLSASQIDSATTIRDLDHGKFYAINLHFTRQTMKIGYPVTSRAYVLMRAIQMAKMK